MAVPCIMVVVSTWSSCEATALISVFWLEIAADRVLLMSIATCWRSAKQSRGEVCEADVSPVEAEAPRESAVTVLLATLRFEA